MKLHNSPFYILIRSWNSFHYFDQCIESVFKQHFNDYTILFVDDCSEYTKDQKQHIKQRLSGHIVVFNKERKHSLRNAYEMLRTYVSDDTSIIFNLDGDDFLSSPKAFQIIQDTYQQTNCLLTYGECFVLKNSWTPSRYLPSRYVLKGLNIRYPSDVEKNNLYRKDYFRPLHPRTWKVDLFRKIRLQDLLDDHGKWFTTCEDQAMYFPMLEMSGGRYHVLRQPLYYYRTGHVISDEVLHRSLQLQDERDIQKKPPYSPLEEQASNLKHNI